MLTLSKIRQRMALEENGKNPAGKMLILDFSLKGMEWHFIDAASGETSSRRIGFGASEEKILTRIENTVYDNPALIDDIPALILLSTPYFLCFPSDMEEDEMLDTASRCFNLENEDIFLTELMPGVTAASGLCAGFRSFVSRTFPGIRIINSCAVLTQSNSVAPAPDEERFMVSRGNAVTNFAVMRGGKLLHASCHTERAGNDIVYFIFKIWNECRLDPKEATLYIDAEKEVRDEILPMLRKHIDFVRILPAPSHGFSAPLPLPAALAYKNFSNQ